MPERDAVYTAADALFALDAVLSRRRSGAGPVKVTGTSTSYGEQSTATSGNNVQAARLLGSTALPVAGVEFRRHIRVVEGGVGVADTIWVCLKQANDTYAWEQL